MPRPSYTYQFPSRLLRLLRKDCRHRPPADCHEIGALLRGLKPPYGACGKEGWLEELLNQLPPDVPRFSPSRSSRFMRFARLYPTYSSKLFGGLRWETVNEIIKLPDAAGRERAIAGIRRTGEPTTRELKRKVLRKTGYPPPHGGLGRRWRPARDPRLALREFHLVLEQVRAHSMAWLERDDSGEGLIARIQSRPIAAGDASAVREFVTAIGVFARTLETLLESVSRLAGHEPVGGAETP